MRAPASSPGIDSWTTVIPHDEGTLIEELDVFNDFLAVSLRSGGLRRLYLADRETGGGRYADLGGEPATFYTSANYSADADSIRLFYTSLTTPWSMISYHVEDDSVKTLKTTFAGEGYDPDLYTAERIMVPAGDGALVPVGMVYRTDLYSPGENPLLLYGYGAYGMSLDPMFSAGLLSLLDRGFIYADAMCGGEAKWAGAGITGAGH